MIDLKNLKAGDTVVHRNGGRSVVEKMSFGSPGSSLIQFQGTDYGFSFTPEGHWLFNGPCPFDIVSIEKAPEPVVGYVNIALGGMVAFETKEKADFYKPDLRDAVIRIEYLPGSDTATATVVK
jgi:hypothetical protein